MLVIVGVIAGVTDATDKFKSMKHKQTKQSKITFSSKYNISIAG